MEARKGDRLVQEANTVGAPPRVGDIVDVATDAAGSTRLTVHWDDGHESVVYPGSDARVLPAAGTAGSSPELRSTRIDLRLSEDDDHCDCTATLWTATRSFRGEGRARRNPTDPNVPMIGEELAIARALQDLSAQLVSAASDAIERHESRPVHLVG